MAVTVQQIRIPQNNNRVNFKFRALLDGVYFTLEFKLNVRCGYWTMNLYDASQSPILCGIYCGVGYPLTVRSSDPRQPIGELYLIDQTGGMVDPGPNDLGTRVALTYRTEVDDG